MSQGQELLNTVELVGDLPAIPETVAEILRLTEDPDIGMAELSGHIGRDPALTAKILRVSNSPYYGMRQHVGTLKLALVILGVREVRNIVLGVSLFDAMNNDKAQRVLANRFWRHSFTVASLGRQLARELKVSLDGEEFIAGLLHDIGKMVLCRQLGERYTQIFHQAGGAGEALCEAERQLLGFTHADAAAAIAIKWNLPKTLCDALWLHHDNESATFRDSKEPRLTAVVRIANASHHAFELADKAASDEAIVQVAEDEAWEALSDAPERIPADGRPDLLREMYEGLSDEKSPVL